MRTYFAILAIVAVAAADSLVRSPEADAPILKQDADVFPDKYQFSYETGNGISASESGVLKNVGREDEALEVQGGNQYTGPDGVVYKIVYVANENGYQPQGAHLPVPPPPQEIPEYILRSIEYNRLHAKPETQVA
ncbi:cuticle protein CP14.6-like [Battus philenor]|uniref:cuticle protein CP14.6-like n=1 Tax=Battus philenor TaxID=42288 RepID=UPI0035D0A50C